MKTLTEDLQALDTKHQREAESLRAKHEVLKHLPALGEYAPPFIYINGGHLYGSAGSLSFQIQRYASIAEGKSPDTGLLRLLLSSFPPVDAIIWRDGCTSFRPEPDAYTNNGEATEIAPVWYAIRPGSLYRQVEAKWYARVGDNLMQFYVQLPMQPYAERLGKLEISYRRMFGRGEITSIEQQNFTPIKKAAYVRFSSGDRATPGDVYVYWKRDDAPANYGVDILDGKNGGAV